MREMQAHSRPRQRRKNDRPNEIIKAGLAAFGDKGFAATRLEDIAHRAGISKGTIYLYFNSKEQLFEAAIQQFSVPFFSDTDVLLSQYQGSTRELLTVLFKRIYEQMQSSEVRTLFRIMMSDGLRFPQLPELYFHNAIVKARAMIERVVQRGVARGEIRQGPASEMPIIIMSPAIMTLNWKLMFEPFDPLDLDRFISAHIDLVLNGILRGESCI